jgi:DNA primase
MSKTVRRRKNPSELLIAGETVKDCLSTLKTTLSARQPQEEDECDLHGKIIAKKLRLLSEDEREQFICEIYQMFRRHNRHSYSSRSETPEYFSPSRTYISTPSPSPLQQQRATSSRTEPPMQQQRATSSRSTYSEPPMQQQRATSSRSTYSEPPMQQQRQRATSSPGIYSKSPMQQQRATTARNIYSELPTCSIYSGAPIEQTLYSKSLPLDPPVISIPEEAPTAGDSSVIILRNELIQQPHEDHTYYSENTSDQPTEGTTDYDNLIEKAFQYA